MVGLDQASEKALQTRLEHLTRDIKIGVGQAGPASSGATHTKSTFTDESSTDKTILLGNKVMRSAHHSIIPRRHCDNTAATVKKCPKSSSWIGSCFVALCVNFSPMSIRALPVNGRRGSGRVRRDPVSGYVFRDKTPCEVEKVKISGIM